MGVLVGTALVAGARERAPEMVAFTRATGDFHPMFRVDVLPAQWTERMRKTTWHNGCPVPVSELRALTVSYWDFGGKPRNGLLIVNKAVAKDLRGILKKLYRQGFLIERMQPVEDFEGNDERSMEANNTSSFNCRDITGEPGRFSNHSWGRAIDINPLTNPYLKGQIVLPPTGRAYLDRSRTYKGGIVDHSYILGLFKKKGWTWGGDWVDRKDYQHFEKPAREIRKR